MLKVGWVVSYGFCNKFHVFQQCRYFENQLIISQRYREFKGRNFFETQCRCSQVMMSCLSWFVFLIYD